MRTQRSCHGVARPVRVLLPLGLFLTLAVAALLDRNSCRADLIFLKDGYILHGRVRQQSEMIVDKGTKDAIWAPKGVFLLDDDARVIMFSPRQVRDVDSKNLNEGADIVALQRPIIRAYGFRMEPILRIDEITAWDDKWERLSRLQSDQGRLNVQQRMSLLTPHFARVDGLKYAWSSFYMTRELGPDTVRFLLNRHPDMQEKNGKPDAVKRFRMYRFLVQAGWLDLADQELETILKDLPDQKEKVEAHRENLRRLRAQQLLDDLERAHKAGRHQWVQEQLAKYPRQAVDEKLLTRLQAIEANYATANENLTLARRLLKELPEKLPETTTHRPLFVESVKTILAELTVDNVQRLDAFVGLATQAERDRKQGKSTQGPVELLSLAMTGWLLGNNSAEAQADMAYRLWRARAFVLLYQKTPGSTRDKLLQNYEQEKGIAFDELAQMLTFLPPPEPEEISAPRLLDLQTKLPGNRRRSINYQLQLPPEYHHGRPYPVLFVLHQLGDKPSAILEKFSEQAAQNGYLLVAPSWERGLRSTYSYSHEEHVAVLDVLLDLRRRFQVDSDRVFVTGFGEGGAMAYDVGLSHPDLFAGVLPMSAQPRLFAQSGYWRNAQYLPFYVMSGDTAGEYTKMNRRIFDQWVPRGYPSLFIEYRGRGAEWFEAELPYMFNWMSYKKREAAFPELGRSAGLSGEEFQTMRSTDNRFYWLSTDSINEKYLNEGPTYSNRVIPAGMQARIAEGNQILIQTRGLKQLTVWLGSKMVDFEKPVTIRVNGNTLLNNRMVKPSLRTLIEDFQSRGDRQRLFLVELPFQLK